MSDRKLCMCCMSPVPAEATACPTCGYDGTQKNPDGLLPIGSRIGKGRYLTGRAENIYTQCVDYIAFDVQQYSTCIVREYLPAGGIDRQSGEMAMQAIEGAERRYRSGLNRFISNYTRMKDLPEDCAIPRVREVIQQNGTAYAVIAKFSGMTLRELLRRNGGTLSVAQTEIVMDPVIDALDRVHSLGLFHGNISPDTILINSNGDVRIEEFCVGDRPVSQKAVGFCSPEYESGEKADSGSDVYSIAAVFYRCVIGTIPQDGIQRKNFDTLTPMGEVDFNVPDNVSDAVWNAMLVNRENRTSSVNGFRDAVKGITSEAVPTFLTDLYYSEQEQAEAAEEEKKIKNRWRYLALISASLLAVMIAVFVISNVFAEKEREKKKQQEPDDSPAYMMVEVPDYRFKKVQDAELDRISFDFLLISTYMEGMETETIVNQDPQPGTMVSPENRTVTLFINKTKDTTAVVPDLSGLYVPNAEHVLRQYGINYTVIFRETENGFPGIVYEQSMEPEQIIKLSDILYVYAQPDPTDPYMHSTVEEVPADDASEEESG